MLQLLNRYYLKGPKAQTSEIFVDGLPGMPDNLKSNKRGSFYVPLVIGRSPYLENIGSYPNLRMIFAKFLGILDFTLQTLDSYYPNIYFKKGSHWVSII